MGIAVLPEILLRHFFDFLARRNEYRLPIFHSSQLRQMPL
jgi:hypothetical protein